MATVYGFYLKIKSRDDPTFKNRAWVLSSDDKVTRIPIPDGLILCDICNKKIETEGIYIHCQTVPDHDEITHGTVCEKCRLEYYPKLAIKGKPPMNRGGQSLDLTKTPNRSEQQLDVIETFLREEIVDPSVGVDETFVPPKILQEAKEILANVAELKMKLREKPVSSNKKYHHCPECGSKSIRTTTDLMVMGLPIITAIKCKNCEETNYVYDPKGRSVT